MVEVEETPRSRVTFWSGTKNENGLLQLKTHDSDEGK